MNSFIDKFSAIERAIVQEKGKFKLFALLEREQVFDTWDAVMASEGLPDNDMSVLEYVVKKIQAVLTREEMIKIGAVILLDVNDRFVKETQQFIEEHHNPTVFSKAEINGVEISRGYIITSPVNVSPNSSELLTKASQWIRKAATLGDSEAQNTLGLMYLKGEGVKRNLSLAKKWLKKAAALGNVQAQSHLDALHH